MSAVSLAIFSAPSPPSPTTLKRMARHQGIPRLPHALQSSLHRARDGRESRLDQTQDQAGSLHVHLSHCRKAPSSSRADPSSESRGSRSASRALYENAREVRAPGAVPPPSPSPLFFDLIGRGTLRPVDKFSAPACVRLSLSSLGPSSVHRPPLFFEGPPPRFLRVGYYDGGPESLFSFSFSSLFHSYTFPLPVLLPSPPLLISYKLLLVGV